MSHATAMQDAVILEVADSETGASLPKCERGGRNYPTIAPESRTTVRHFSSISFEGANPRPASLNSGPRRPATKAQQALMDRRCGEQHGALESIVGAAAHVA